MRLLRAPTLGIAIAHEGVMPRSACSKIITVSVALACFSILSGCYGRREPRHEERREHREERREQREERRER
jgi:hypothetical protein